MKSINSNLELGLNKSGDMDDIKVSFNADQRQGQGGSNSQQDAIKDEDSSSKVQEFDRTNFMIQKNLQIVTNEEDLI